MHASQEIAARRPLVPDAISGNSATSLISGPCFETIHVGVSVTKLNEVSSIYIISEPAVLRAQASRALSYERAFGGTFVDFILLMICFAAAASVSVLAKSKLKSSRSLRAINPGL